jgi:hypothetical protein
LIMRTLDNYSRLRVGIFDCARRLLLISYTQTRAERLIVMRDRKLIDEWWLFWEMLDVLDCPRCATGKSDSKADEFWKEISEEVTV